MLMPVKFFFDYNCTVVWAILSKKGYFKGSGREAVILPRLPYWLNFLLPAQRPTLLPFHYPILMRMTYPCVWLSCFMQCAHTYFEMLFRKKNLKFLSYCTLERGVMGLIIRVHRGPFYYKSRTAVVFTT